MPSNSFLWHDAKVEKPTHTDPVLCLTSLGFVVIAQYDSRQICGKWYELRTNETFDDVVWWSDFHLPHGWNISDLYSLGE